MTTHTTPTPGIRLSFNRDYARLWVWKKVWIIYY